MYIGLLNVEICMFIKHYSQFVNIGTLKKTLMNFYEPLLPVGEIIFLGFDLMS